MTEIPKEIIELAIKGGFDWKKALNFPADCSVSPSEATALSMALAPQVILSLLFWQCLGKSCGWEKTEDGRDWEASRFGYMEVWRHYAHSFYDLILTSSDTTPFWQEIIDSKKI